MHGPATDSAYTYENVSALRSALGVLGFTAGSSLSFGDIVDQLKTLSAH